MFREFWDVRVLRDLRVWALLRLLLAEGVERGFDAEAALAAAALGSGFFRSGEGKEAKGE